MAKDTESLATFPHRGEPGEVRPALSPIRSNVEASPEYRQTVSADAMRRQLVNKPAPNPADYPWWVVSYAGNVSKPMQARDSREAWALFCDGMKQYPSPHLGRVEEVGDAHGNPDPERLQREWENTWGRKRDREDTEQDPNAVPPEPKDLPQPKRDPQSKRQAAIAQADRGYPVGGTPRDFAERERARRERDQKAQKLEREVRAREAKDFEDAGGQKARSENAAKTSPVANYNASEAADHISRFTSKDKLQDCIDCDERKTVQEAAQKRLDELNK